MVKIKTFIATFFIVSTLILSKTCAQQPVPFKEYEADRYPISAIAFSPDGNILAIGYDRSIRLVDIKRNETINTLQVNRIISGEIVFSPDGKFIASGNKNDVRVWRTKNGRRFRNFKGHEKSVNCVAFSSDGKFLASGSDDEDIRIWDLKAEEEPLHLLIPNPTKYNQEIQQLFFLPNSDVLMANHFGHSKLRFWDINTGILLNDIETWFSLIYSIDFSNDWKKFVFGAYGGMQLWNLENEELVRDIIGPFEGYDLVKRLDYIVHDVDLSPDEKTVVATQRKSVVELWDATTTAREPMAILEGHKGEVSHVAFSPDGHLVASGDSHGIVRLWEVDMFLTNQKAPEDINRDGTVNILDLVFVASYFGTSDTRTDVNGDGVVNILDLVAVANEF